MLTKRLPILLLALATITQAAPGKTYPSELGALSVTSLAQNLEQPWALAFLPDHQGLLVIERPGRLRLLDAQGRLSTPLAGVPAVWAQGQGGLLDVALSPGFAKDRMVYLSFAEGGGPNGGAGTAVGCGRLSVDHTRLEDFKVIFRQQPKLNPWTGALWTHEHGPRGGDEVNIVQAGGNYGWPVVTQGINYSGQPIPEARGTSLPGMLDPAHVWPVSPAISGMAFYTSDKSTPWAHNLFIGALKDRSLIRLQLEGDKVVHQERLLGALQARIREVREGPDGALYLLTDARDGELLRVELKAR